MIVANCKKRPYFAMAVQWGGGNYDEVANMLHSGKCFPDHPVSGAILVRTGDGIFTLFPTDWAVRGENGVTKRYTDVQFRTKYELL